MRFSCPLLGLLLSAPAPISSAVLLSVRVPSADPWEREGYGHLPLATAQNIREWR